MVLWVSPWCWAIWLLFRDLSLGWRSVCLLIRCVYLRGCFGCCGKIRALCILFSLIARKRGASLAAFARNVCFSRKRCQDLRPMYPFRGAIGRFRIHSARILPGRPLFCVEVPRIIHGAKILPTLGRGPFRSGGQNKGSCCVGRGHAHATCPFPASASLDTRRLKKAAILPFMENGRCDRGKCLSRLRKSLR